MAKTHRILAQVFRRQSLRDATLDRCCNCGDSVWIGALSSAPNGKRTAIPSRVEIRSGLIASSLFAATDTADVPDAGRPAENSQYRIDFHRDLRRGDQFRVGFEAGLYRAGRVWPARTASWPPNSSARVPPAFGQRACPAQGRASLSRREPQPAKAAPASGRERGAAAAGTVGIRVADDELGSLQPFGVIDFSAHQVLVTHRVDEQGHAVLF